MQGNLTNPTSPYSSIDTSAISFPSFAAPTSGMCNADLPNESTLNRYLYVIQYYVQQVTVTCGHVPSIPCQRLQVSQLLHGPCHAVHSQGILCSTQSSRCEIHSCRQFCLPCFEQGRHSAQHF